MMPWWPTWRPSLPVKYLEWGRNAAVWQCTASKKVWIPTNFFFKLYLFMFFDCCENLCTLVHFLFWKQFFFFWFHNIFFYCSLHFVQLYRCHLGSHIGLEGSRRHLENSPSEKGNTAYQPVNTFSIWKSMYPSLSLSFSYTHNLIILQGHFLVNFM